MSVHDVFVCFTVQAELILYEKCFTTYVTNLLTKGDLALLAYSEEESKLEAVMRYEFVWPTS
jgi:hypothetical protein